MLSIKKMNRKPVATGVLSILLICFAAAGPVFAEDGTANTCQAASSLSVLVRAALVVGGALVFSVVAALSFHSLQAQAAATRLARPREPNGPSGQPMPSPVRSSRRSEPAPGISVNAPDFSARW